MFVDGYPSTPAMAAGTGCSRWPTTPR